MKFNSSKLSHLYNLGKQFVKYYPKFSTKCQSMQTFAVIEDYSYLNTPNLAKTLSDLHKPFFYSTDWAKANYNPSKLTYSYPAMVMLERPGIMSNPFCNTNKTCYKIEIAILDKYDRACAEKGEGCKECAKRTINEIYMDCEKFMKTFFSYMADVVYIKDQGFVNKAVYEASDGVGVIDQVVTRQFQKSLSEVNKSTPLVRWWGGLDDLYGVFTEITFCIEECDNYLYEPSIVDFKIGPDLNCCD